MRGTAQARVAAAPAEAHRPRFTNPVAGSVYALDPDIPADRQRLVIGVSGSATAHRIQLESRDLGPADHCAPVMPGPGLHRLRLVDGGGRIVDQILFTVR